MSTAEHSIDTTAPPEAIWRAWTDVAHWPRWNADIEHIELSGPFATGSTIAMTTRDQNTIQLRLAEVLDGKRFIDEAHVAGTAIHTTHEIERLGDGRTRVTYRLHATGPAAQELAPAISSDFPQTLAALSAYAG